MIRRDFMRRAGRITMLGILGGGSAYLVHNHLTADPGTCSVNPFCRVCGEKTSCNTFVTHKKARHAERERQ